MTFLGANAMLRSQRAVLAFLFIFQTHEIALSQNRFKTNEVGDFLGAIQLGHDSEAAAMLESNTNLAFARDNLTKLPLLEAAAAGNVPLIKRLLALGVDVNAAGDTTMSVGAQRTALHSAISRGHLDVCRALLETGADPNRMAFGFETPLHLAFKEGREEIAGLLLDYGAEPFQGKPFSNNDTTPFELAITNSNGKLVARMLGQEPQDPLGSRSLQKLQPSARPSRGMKTSQEVLSRRGTELLTAAAQRGELEAVRALIHAGVTVRNANTNCPTILQSFSISANEAARTLPSAVERWHQAQARLKEDYIPRADPNFVASLRLEETTLAASVEALTPERWHNVFQALVQNGVDYDAFSATALGDTNQTSLLLTADKTVAHTRDCNGQTPLHWAVQTDKLPMAAFWINAGVPLDVTNLAGQTALHLAGAEGKENFVRTLLTAGASANIRDTNRWTALDAAIQAKRSTCIHLLLKGDSAPAHPERGLATPLHEAASIGNIAALVGLLETETNLEARNELGLNPLQVAVQNGHLAAAALLVDKGANVNARDPEGNTLLLQIIPRYFNLFVRDRPSTNWLDRMGNDSRRAAVQKYPPVGQYEQGGPHAIMQTVSFLVACGIDIKATNHAGQTAMQLATDQKIALFDEREPLLKLLGGAGGDLKQRDADGNTVLHRSVNAVDANDVERLAAIIAAGADINATNAAGQTPLHIAASKIYGWDSNEPGTNAPFQMLVHLKANVNARDNHGRTPLHVLAAADTSFKSEAIRLLVQAGADPNLQDHQGGTALHAAAGSGLPFNEGAVRNLLDAGANPNILDKHGRTAVHLFLGGAWPWHSASSCLQELASAKADFSIKDDQGRTPLHYLAALGSQKPLFFIRGIDRILMEGKVDFQARDDSGNTPLHIAAKTGTPDVVDWLVKHGADLDATNRLGVTPRSLMPPTRH